jgi:hypothetical protein
LCLHVAFFSQRSISQHEFQIHQRRCGGIDFTACAGCGEFHRNYLKSHEPQCILQKEQEEEIERAAIAAERIDMKRQGLLTQGQLNALQNIEKSASKLSADARSGIAARFHTLGYDQQHLRMVLRFIRNNAPMVIHVNLQLRQALLTDTHYRNQHETGFSCGSYSPSSRIAAETRMFGASAYDASTPPAERPRYGALDSLADQDGVASAMGYGDSYLLLKNETMRARATIAPQDSLGTCPPLGTCEHFCHILQHYTDPELNELIAVAVGEKKFAKSRSDYVYREIQYHGEIRLDRDIASLHVNARHAADASTMKLIEEFRKRYKVEIIMLEAKK